MFQKLDIGCTVYDISKIDFSTTNVSSKLRVPLFSEL